MIVVAQNGRVSRSSISEAWIRFSLFLGHGRALESYLVGVKMLFGVFVLVPHGSVHIIALNDLLWYVPETVIALPFFVIGLVQLFGMLMNYIGREWSWIPRAVGAGAAICMWVWFITKLVYIDAVITGMMPFCVMSLLGSIWIYWKAWNRLPVPGAAGLV